MTTRARDVETEDGARLRVLEDGDGPPMLLVSGLGGTAGFWQPVVPALARGHRVIRLDQRGIAASTRGRAGLDIDRLAADCRQVLDALDTGPAVLVGHSTGGCIVQAMGLDMPETCTRLVLSGTWSRANRYMAELFASRRTLLRAAPREYTAMSTLMAYPPDWLEANWPAFEAALAQAPLDPAVQDVIDERIGALLAYDRGEALAALAAPALVLGTEDDLIVPAFLQRALAQDLAHARIAMLPKGGHFFPVTAADAFVRALTDWAAA